VVSNHQASGRLTAVRSDSAILIVPGVVVTAVITVTFAPLLLGLTPFLGSFLALLAIELDQL